MADEDPLSCWSSQEHFGFSDTNYNNKNITNRQHHLHQLHTVVQFLNLSRWCCQIVTSPSRSVYYKMLILSLNDLSFCLHSLYHTMYSWIKGQRALFLKTLLSNALITTQFWSMPTLITTFNGNLMLYSNMTLVTVQSPDFRCTSVDSNATLPSQPKKILQNVYYVSNIMRNNKHDYDTDYMY